MPTSDILKSRRTWIIIAQSLLTVLATIFPQRFVEINLVLKSILGVT